MRGLSNTFIKDLQSGVLNKVLQRIKTDATLCLEIRENYIDICYRGGNAIKIREKDTNYYEFSFASKYLDDPSLKARLSSLKAVRTDSAVMQWIDELANIKNRMDLWLAQHSKNERDYLQMVVRDNNYGGAAHDTDYYICDIEYAYKNGKIDMVAVKWPSTASQRKQNQGLGLAFIEMKYMDRSLAGREGLVAHIKNMNTFLSAPNNLSKIKDEIKLIFNQKVELGLVKGINKITSFNDYNPEYILIFANHDPDKKSLYRELQKAMEIRYADFGSKADLKVATSCLMGFGLYDECIYPLDEFLQKYSHIIKGTR